MPNPYKAILRRHTVPHHLRAGAGHARARLVALRHVEISTPEDLIAWSIHSISGTRQSIGRNPTATLYFGLWDGLRLRLLVSRRCIA